MQTIIVEIDAEQTQQLGMFAIFFMMHDFVGILVGFSGTLFAFMLCVDVDGAKGR